jgi:hypothetical protein
MFWIGLGVLCIIAAIALGVGLGVGLSRKDSSGPSTTTSSSSSNTSTPAGPLLNVALAETSLASVQTLDGAKHLFFQDVNGSLRHNVYSASSNSWLPEADFVWSSSLPKNMTPIAVAEDYMSNLQQILILLFYIDVNNQVRGLRYPIAEKEIFGNITNGTFPTLEGTRSLAFTRVPFPSEEISNYTSNSNLSIRDGGVLYYESPSKSIVAFHGLWQERIGEPYSEGQYEWVWRNLEITSRFLGNQGSLTGGPVCVFNRNGSDLGSAQDKNTISTFITKASLTESKNSTFVRCATLSSNSTCE